MKTSFRQTAFAALVVASTVLMTGCVTPYQSAGATGGYRDRQIDDQTLHIEFSGNGYTSQQIVHKYFIYRCAELTQQHGFKYFMVVPPSLAGALPVTGTLARSTGFDHSMMRKAYYVPIIIPSGGGGVTRHAESADIRMFNDDAVLTMKVAGWDAAEVLDQLGPFVHSGGQTAADVPKAWVFEPGKPKARAQDLLPTAPKKDVAAGT